MPQPIKKAETRYGPKKLGEKAFAAQQENKKAELGGRVYGERKMGARKDPNAVDFAELSVKALEAHLEENPSALDSAIQAELARENPRKGAVKALLELEQDATEPRPVIVAALQEVLGGEQDPPAGDQDPPGGDEDPPAGQEG